MSAYLRARRWGSIVLAAVFGASACIFSIPILDRSVQSFSGYLEHFSYSAVVFFGFLMAALVGYEMSNIGALRKGHFSGYSILRFPPIWVAGVLGSLFYIAFRKLGHYQHGGDYASISSEFIFIYWCFVSFAVWVGVVTRGYISEGYVPEGHIRDRRGEDYSLFEIDEEGGEFLKWLQKEGPIESPAQDTYARLPIARRIARLLGEDGFQTVGITGEFGCGKSSIIALTRYLLREEAIVTVDAPLKQSDKVFDQLIECHVNTLGFSRKNIAQHILADIVETLSDHLDTVALKSIPNQYVTALNKVGGNWVDAILSLASSPRDPLMALLEVEKVLICIKCRFVVFIEDVDRNSNEDLVKVELFALLDRLKEMRNISFVLAIGNESSLFKYITRVLEHNEPIQALQMVESRSVIAKFRRIVKGGIADRCIFICGEEEADERLGLSHVDERIFDRDGLNDRATITHMAKLLDTPRLQKMLLRRTWSAWQSLWGEVDLDELLAINILRHSVPSAYAFVNDNLNLIRRAGVDSKCQDQLLALVDEQVTKIGWRGIHAKNLIEFLFPSACSKGISQKSIRPQRVEDVGVTDYWVRIAREELLEDDTPRDQEILQAISAWQGDPEAIVFEGKSFADTLIDVPQFAERFEYFGVCLRSAEILSLSSQLFAQLLERRIEPEYDPDSRNNYPGFIELWRMYNKRDQFVDERWLLDELRIALHRDFRFSNEVYYFWRPDRTESEQVYKEYVDMAKSLYSTNIELFVNVLPRDYPYCLYHFCVHFSSPDQKGPGFSALKWAWLGKTLVQAVEMSPELVIPQLAVLLTEEHRDIALVRHYDFLPDRAEALWGKRFKLKLKSLIELGASLDLREECSGRIQVISDALA